MSSLQALTLHTKHITDDLIISIIVAALVSPLNDVLLHVARKRRGAGVQHPRLDEANFSCVLSLMMAGASPGPTNAYYLRSPDCTTLFVRVPNSELLTPKSKLRTPSSELPSLLALLQQALPFFVYKCLQVLYHPLCARFEHVAKPALRFQVVCNRQLVLGFVGEPPLSFDDFV